MSLGIHHRNSFLVEVVEVADARAQGVRQLRLLLTALRFRLDARFSEPSISVILVQNEGN